jgi:hypothetical protein
MEISGQFNVPAASPPERKLRGHVLGGSVGLKAGVDIAEKRKSPALTGIEP